MIRVLYAGSPKPSSVTLENLIQKQGEHFEIVGVLTNPPSAQGRHKTLISTSVCDVAKKYNIPVFEPEHLDSILREKISALNVDILVCFAYGHIFGPKFMALFKFGGINLHPSALPKYRGCTPVNAAILNLDEQTAFTIQKVSESVDEGNILAQKKIDLKGAETAFSLLNDAAICGAEMFEQILCELDKTRILPEGVLQTGEPSYTKMILKENAKINWSDSAKKVCAFVRAYYSEPCAWTIYNGENLKILEGAFLEDESLVPDKMKNAKSGTVCVYIKSMGIIVKCGTGFYAIKTLQKQGKNAMDYKSFLNGARDFIGTVLG